MILELRNKILLKFNNNFYFEYIIPFVFVAFGIFGWQFGFIFGVVPTVILSAVLMILFDVLEFIKNVLNLYNLHIV